MNDPIVEELNYKLKLSSELSFKNPPILVEDFEDFTLTLDKEDLVIQMKAKCRTEEQARILVDPHLKAWELDIFLTRGRMDFWFEFIKSKIVDRNPPPSNVSGVIQANVIECAMAGDKYTAQITMKTYPLPPRSLLYTPDVESLSKRYEGFLNGKEPLLSMAYFCLSLIQLSANGRKNAANNYNIDGDVLKLLGKLTSEHGDKTQARKLDKNSTLSPLTEPQLTWIRDTIKILIRRKAEYDFDSAANFTVIDFNSLPPIKLLD